MVVHRDAGWVRARGTVSDCRALDLPDWRVTIAAERALARLGTAATPALPALSRVMTTHWLPRARKLAEEARASISAQTRGLSEGTSYLARMQPEMHHDFLNGPPVEGGCREQVHSAADGWKAKKDLGTDKPPTGLSVSKYGVMGRFVTERVGDGQLVGSDRGEFGGDLRWLSQGN